MKLILRTLQRKSTGDLVARDKTIAGRQFVWEEVPM